MTLWVIEHSEDKKIVSFDGFRWHDHSGRAFKSYKYAVDYVLRKVDDMIYGCDDLLQKGVLSSSDGEQIKIIDLLREDTEKESRTARHIQKFDKMKNAEFLFYMRKKVTNTRNGLPKIQRKVIDTILKERKENDGLFQESN